MAAAPGSAPSSLSARLRAALGGKVRVWLGLAVGICIPYFTLQRVTFFPERVVPETPLDAWIAFDPAWVWPYVSLALLVPLAPALAATREELARYARGLFGMCALCFVMFLVMPVAGPRPEIVPDHAAYAAIVGVDRPLNSFPSLHAGLTTYSLLFAAWTLRGTLAPPARRAVAATGALWGVAILYATLATKQHWFVDVPAGMAAAIWAHARAARPVRG